MDLISRQIPDGTWLRLTTDFSEIPIEGELIDHDDHFILISGGRDGARKLVSINHILQCGLDISRHPAKHEIQLAASKGADPEETVAEEEEEEKLDLGLYSPADVSLPGVKVVGKIDLDYIKPRAKRPQNTKPETDKTDFPRLPYELANLPLNPKGTVKSVGPTFGFITDSEGNDLYFSGMQALSHLNVGDKVIFSTGVGKQGPHALAVNTSANVGQAFGVIKRTMRMGKRFIASDVKQQILEAYPDNEELADALENLDGHREENVRIKSETRENRPENAARLELRLAEELLPDNYDKYVEEILKLLEKMENSENPFDKRFLHRTYTRLIKNAREEDCPKFARRAADYYERNGEPKSAAFFANMAEKRQAAESDTDSRIRRWTTGLRKEKIIDPYTSEMLRRHQLTEGFTSEGIDDGSVTDTDVLRLRDDIASGRRSTPEAHLTMIKLSGIMLDGYDPRADLHRYFRMMADRLLEEEADRELVIFNLERAIRYNDMIDFAADKDEITLHALMTIGGYTRDEILNPDPHVYDIQVLTKMEDDCLPDLYTRLSRLADTREEMRRHLGERLSEAGMRPLPRMTRRNIAGQSYRMHSGEPMRVLIDRFKDYLDEFDSIDGTIASERHMAEEMLSRMIPAAERCANGEPNADNLGEAIDIVKSMMDEESLHRSDLSFSVLRPMMDTVRLILSRQLRRLVNSTDDSMVQEPNEESADSQTPEAESGEHDAESPEIQ